MTVSRSGSAFAAAWGHGVGCFVQSELGHIELGEVIYSADRVLGYFREARFV